MNPKKMVSVDRNARAITENIFRRLRAILALPLVGSRSNDVTEHVEKSKHPAYANDQCLSQSMELSGVDEFSRMSETAALLTTVTNIDKIIRDEPQILPHMRFCEPRREPSVIWLLVGSTDGQSLLPSPVVESSTIIVISTSTGFFGHGMYIPRPLCLRSLANRASLENSEALGLAVLTASA